MSSSAAPALLVGDPIMFSEYVEGSSQNKALELWNRSWMAVDLAGYSIQVHSFTTTPERLDLSGTLAPNAVLVVCNSQAGSALAPKCNQLWTALQFNGDETVILQHGADNADIFGNGQDPGTSWGTTVKSVDMTLRRRCGVTPVTLYPASFDPADQWLGFPIDDFSGLGAPECAPYSEPLSSSSSGTSTSSGSVTPGTPGSAMWTFTSPLGDLTSAVAADHGLVLTSWVHVTTTRVGETRLITRTGDDGGVLAEDHGILRRTAAGILRFDPNSGGSAWVQTFVPPLRFTQRLFAYIPDFPPGLLNLSLSGDEFVVIDFGLFRMFDMTGTLVRSASFIPGADDDEHRGVLALPNGVVAVGFGDDYQLGRDTIRLVQPDDTVGPSQSFDGDIVDMQFEGDSLVVLITDERTSGLDRALVQFRDMTNTVSAAVESTNFRPTGMALMAGGDLVLSGRSPGALQYERPVVRRINRTDGSLVWEYRPPEEVGVEQAIAVDVAPNGDLYIVLGTDAGFSPGPLMASPGRAMKVQRLVP